MIFIAEGKNVKKKDGKIRNFRSMENPMVVNNF